MPFLRFSRDKRGYENFYLVEPTTRRGRSRSRILYWFRTPPGVRIGRLPFDDPVRRSLEARYPNVVFDWQKLIDTPIPPPAPDVERWRERRRLERAAKQAAASEAAAENGPPASEEEPLDEPAPESVPTASAGVASAAVGSAATLPADAASRPARRRRRRSGRRGRSGGGAAASGAVEPQPPGEATGPRADANQAGRNED